jgi:hypothetical protein
MAARMYILGVKDTHWTDGKISFSFNVKMVSASGINDVDNDSFGFEASKFSSPLELRQEMVDAAIRHAASHGHTISKNDIVSLINFSTP